MREGTKLPQLFNSLLVAPAQGTWNTRWWRWAVAVVYLTSYPSSFVTHTPTAGKPTLLSNTFLKKISVFQLKNNSNNLTTATHLRF